MRNSHVRNASIVALAAASTLFGAAPITIVVADPPGIGFNDTRPAAPVGGNTGTTVGAQRLNAFRYAAGIWSSKLDSSLPIRVRAGFAPLPCTAETGVAGGAQPIKLFTLIPLDSDVLPNILYPAALANKLTGKVLDPGTEEIQAIFNSGLGQPDCLAAHDWYYGLDTQTPPNQVNMAVLILHELAHGLGFLPMLNPDGSRLGGFGDIYSQYVFDTSAGKTWNQMSDAERAASLTNVSHVVWNGVNVRNDAPKVLLPGTPALLVTGPASIAGDIRVGTADFGPPLASTGVSGELVLALDPKDDDGPLSTDACSPLVNTAEVAGRIALADRGSCTFVQKALNAQAAGALGLVVVNNLNVSPPADMTGADPAVTIPAVFITQADGNALKAVLATFEKPSVRLFANPNVLRGADASGRPMLYASNPVTTLSPIGHWDPSATPNQLMEPDVPADAGVTLEPPDDLTLSLLRDLGWFNDGDGVPDGVDQCPGSDRGATLVIQGCDTGVRNTTFQTGCRISDYYKPCAAGGAGNFAACADSVSQDMLQAGVIAAADPAKIHACAVRSAP